jgi:hypothetical protein
MEKETWEKLDIPLPPSIEKGFIYGCPFASENRFA